VAGAARRCDGMTEKQAEVFERLDMCPEDRRIPNAMRRTALGMVERGWLRGETFDYGVPDNPYFAVRFVITPEGRTAIRRARRDEVRP
jgi:hypothetical protein